MIRYKGSGLIDAKAPHQNKSLTNLKDEKWKEIPEGQGSYLISNFGRIKSLPRYIEIHIPSQKRSIAYYTKEKILSVKVHKKWNKVVRQAYYECTVSIRISGEERTYLVSRLVYHAFVKKLNFAEDRLMIMHKDGNGLNNHYKNLISGTRSEVTQRAYNAKRHVSPFSLMTKKKKKQIARKSLIKKQKAVIQFSLAGKKIRRFDSIKNAANTTSLADSNINRVLRGNGITAGGYIWKYDTKRTSRQKKVTVLKQ